MSEQTTDLDARREYEAAIEWLRDLWMDDYPDYSDDKNLAHAMGQAAKEVEDYVAVLVKALRAVLDSGLASHAHWDHTMQYGAGCELCIRQGQAADKARAALAGITP